MKLFVNQRIKRLFLCILLSIAAFAALCVSFACLKLKYTVLYTAVAAVLAFLFIFV